MKDVDLSNPDVVRYVVNRFGLRMNKKLGQNFLIRHAVVDDIAAAAELKPGDPVLEIGPGIGTLTQALAETGAAVTAVELDDHLLPVLDKTLEHYDNVRVVHGDIMRIDIAETMNHKPFKVCANLPYYITTPIIMKLLEQKLPIEKIVVMVQKEVAERMVAAPGSKIYGACLCRSNTTRSPGCCLKFRRNALCLRRRLRRPSCPWTCGRRRLYRCRTKNGFSRSSRRPFLSAARPFPIPLNRRACRKSRLPAYWKPAV